ncbi:hypothetical protein Q4517_07330 [Tenacibaculum sp. 1_MG-2023]|uniref:hypothetical protein n=1 Tax=Tenacibaculum sp. 1_MG-2023 TaxID=3062653 RepID=UPI0026E3B728|nr:hypothetical protein [Tenacibaculum sp. 1_MG-2023]MDO6675360.1 hypothetical protein [Tenacibaculum sp. 1_MG-2023]
MSFGFGPASEMNKTVQRLKRSKPDTFKKLGQLNNQNNYTITDKKATKKQLSKIREKIKKENNKALLKKALFFTLFLVLFIYFIYF